MTYVIGHKCTLFMIMASNKEKGSFATKLTDPTVSNFDDFENPWNFSGLMHSNTAIVHKWMRHRGLILTQYVCDTKNYTKRCGKIAKVTARPTKADGETLRCGAHEYSIRKNSFFEKSHFGFPDLMNFIKCYLDGDLLCSIAKKTGMAYKSTALEWAKHVRMIFKEYIYQNVHGLQNMMLSGIVEIDESLFGRKVKYNKGNPHLGLKVLLYF